MSTDRWEFTRRKLSLQPGLQFKNLQTIQAYCVWHRDTALEWLAESDLIAEFSHCIDGNIGPNSFWRLALVDHYIDAAWAEDVEMLGPLPAHPEYLFLAAQQLELVQVTELDFRRYWGRATDDPQAMCEIAFDGLLRLKRSLIYEDCNSVERTCSTSAPIEVNSSSHQLCQ